MNNKQKHYKPVCHLKACFHYKRCRDYSLYGLLLFLVLKRGKKSIFKLPHLKFVGDFRFRF